MASYYTYKKDGKTYTTNSKADADRYNSGGGYSSGGSGGSSSKSKSNSSYNGPDYNFKALGDAVVNAQKYGSAENYLASVYGIKQPTFNMPSYNYNPEPTLSYSEAMQRAQDQLNPLYDDQLQSTLKNVEQNLIKRGFFGQMPSVPITREETARVENAKNAAVSSLANQMVGQSESQAQEAERLAQQQYAQQAQAALAKYNAQVGAQQSGIDNLLAAISLANERNQQDRDFGLQEAELTGTYNGAPTLQAQMSALTEAYLPFLQNYGNPALAGDLSTVLSYLYGY